MEKLNPLHVGSAMALTAGTVSLICALAVFLFPDGMINFVNAWFHGLDLTIIKSNKPWTLGGVAYGLFGATVTGFLSGVVFAFCYNLVGNCPVCRREPWSLQRRRN